LFPSFINPEDQFHLSMAISLGICDFLKRYVSFCTIKWPNDIYVNNDKIAGILVESSIMDSKIEYSIAGIGLNINQENFTGVAPNPVSLLQLTGRKYDLNVCLNQLTTDLDGRYKQLIAGNSGQIRKDYVSKLFRLNEWCEYKDLKANFTGRILTISDSGRIRIERQNGEMAEYSFKELEFIL
jgi:BirA family biotin operon repressor/biotin-[acetyl-CoA-carboxylase] ligase